MANEPAAKRIKSSSPSVTTTTNGAHPSSHNPVITDSFLASLFHPLLRPPGRATKANTGLRVLAPGSGENPKVNTSIRFEDIDYSTLPSIVKADLPIPLDDARRKYASGILGVKLTHPGGALEGGPGVVVAADPSVSSPAGRAAAIDTGTTDVVMTDNDTDPDLYGKLPTQVRDFLRKHDISSQEQLREVIKRELGRNVEDLRKRMREREEAVESNRQIDEKIEELVEEREMERRVHEKARKTREGGGVKV